jgi:hypothetical protein
MSSRALRRTAAALIAAVLFAFSAVPPAYALPGRAAGRHADGERGLITFLLRWIAKAGGAMDPNGNH